MSWRPAIRCPIIVTIGITIILLLSGSPRRASADQSQAATYYLPIVRVEWEPPCGGVPFLISPSDGSVFTGGFKVVFDGGYRAGANDWLEVEVSSSPDFENSIKRYFQPAGKRWEVDYWIYFYGTTHWYWRASVWCNGPGEFPPPVGYQQSPYSKVWSFTINFYPYPPP